VRSDVAIARKRAPEEGHSRRLRSREAPIRESGGTILPTTRPADLSQHDRRHRPATSPLGQGAPSDGQPASSRPIPGRGVRLVRGRGLRLRGSPCATDLRRRPSGPKRAGGRSYENGLASTTETAVPKHSVPATDAGRLALGRAATARRLATPDAVPARQGCIGARPDAFAYCLKCDPNPSSRQPGCGSRIADSCAWIPDRRTIHRPFIHGIAHRPAPKLT
jgi:hypothetical protein